MDFLIIIPLFLFWPIVIIGIVVSRRKRKGYSAVDREWYLQLALSRKDVASQLPLLIAAFFLGMTLTAFNRDFGNVFSWQTILFATFVMGLIGAYYLKVLYLLAFSLIGSTVWWWLQTEGWIQEADSKMSVIIFWAGFCGSTLLFIGAFA